MQPLLYLAYLAYLHIRIYMQPLLYLAYLDTDQETWSVSFPHDNFFPKLYIKY